MSRAPRGSGRPNAQEQAKVSYPEIRERLLASSSSGDYVEWLTEVGRYIHHCWLAEERERVPGFPLDEAATKHLWDECSERDLVQLRTEALVHLKNHRRKEMGADVARWIARSLAPWGARASVWLVTKMVEGFVAGIGLIVLGLLIAWIEPKLMKDLRAAVDDALPASTAPHAPGDAVKKSPS